MVDKTELRKWWDTFVGDGNFTEVRVLGKFAYSGYFSSFDKLATQIDTYENMDDEQIYFVLNQIEKECYARPQCERFIKSPKATTNDANICRRLFLLLDFDPRRASQTNSSNEAFELAHKKAQEVYKFLVKEKGFSDSIICVSGNGWHILVPVDLPNDEETNKIVRDFYKYMGSIFSDDKVDFDESVHTPARLTKLYSTTAKKGANIPSNPWRRSKIVYIPKELTPTPIEKIKELAELLPKEEPKQAPNRVNRQFGNANVPFDLRTWLNGYGIVYREESNGDGTKFILEHCPWEDTHSSKQKWDSALFQNGDGQITFSCFHSHCKDKTWHDVRLYYEPDAYSKPAFQPRMPYAYHQPIPQKPKYQIKEENPELGKKWFSLSDIKKIDLSSIKTMKTGFHELDKAIGGLAEGEVSILSGSNSSGKSSWLNSVSLNVINGGGKVALWSGELRPDILKTWIQLVAAGRHNVKPSKYDDRYYVPNEVSQKIDEWLDGKFFLYNNEYSAKWEQIFNDMNELLTLGVSLFVLDNLFSLDIDVLDGDKNNKQKELIIQLCQFAKKNKVHIILVCHPRKGASCTYLRKTDISGTADLANAVDNIFIAHRVNNDFFRGVAEFLGKDKVDLYKDFGNVIEIAKNRMYGVVDRMFGMYYDIPTRRFMNTQNEEFRYEWEREPEPVSMIQEEPSAAVTWHSPEVLQSNTGECPF